MEGERAFAFFILLSAAGSIRMGQPGAYSGASV